MGLYVSFWGGVPGRVLHYSVHEDFVEQDAIMKDIHAQCERARVSFAELTVNIGNGGVGVLQASSGKRYFYGSDHGLIELPEGVLCPHRTSVGYHTCGKISCPICGHQGIRLAWRRLGWAVP